MNSPAKISSWTSSGRPRPPSAFGQLVATLTRDRERLAAALRGAGSLEGLCAAIARHLAADYGGAIEARVHRQQNTPESFLDGLLAQLFRRLFIACAGGSSRFCSPICSLRRVSARCGASRILIPRTRFVSPFFTTA